MLAGKTENVERVKELDEPAYEIGRIRRKMAQCGD